jgi:drug/metabolite transporter (DMT)-like permease
MSTNEIHRSRWFMPLFCLFLGAIMFAAFTIGGDVIQGAISFGIMAALAAVFAFARRSETVQGIGGPGRDERWDMIDLRATAFAGGVVIAVALAGFVVQVARGEDPGPYVLIAATGGAAYIAAVAWFRSRG